ncbi:hypothetical protein SSPSH_000873 [Salinisphaera shabanensis E1L3A]|uniref:Uncharacterized protein n=1 Tax=Salinisphaera shabanensis E1L3A TaxID=1033802 RepID=U2FVT4_9GAMM|nr:hypothetical protein SSPSH_000873 [Salinisphaera shabanensis E1L3A]
MHNTIQAILLCGRSAGVQLRRSALTMRSAKILTRNAGQSAHTPSEECYESLGSARWPARG